MTAPLAIAAQAGIVGGTDARAIIIGLLTGIAFGAILQRTGASSYHMIVNMLRLKDLTIMKLLFLGIAVGSVGMYVVNAVDTAHIGIAPVYLLGIAVGGLVFGVGWALAGYCPGTALVAMSEGKADAAITVLGGLAGAATLAVSWDYLKPVLVDPLNYGGKSLYDALGVNPLLVALVLAAALIAFVIYLDRIDSRPGRQAGKRLDPTARPEL
ncbi:putative inner membrane protein [bacterium BMS3Abin01]|nr:putative inner membrane protein [bacterium BMS3Abin01]